MRTMNKNLWQVLAIVLVATFALFSTVNAGWFGSDKDKVTMEGSINAFGQFIDNEGETFELSDNDESLEVKALTGQQVEIKGTVLEEEGRKTLEVKEYKILEEEGYETPMHEESPKETPMHEERKEY